MSNGNIVFQAAVLQAGKRGIIRPDAAGYYTQCIGGLNVQNAHGDTYAAEKAIRLFDQSGDLQRRILDRALRGETGHPKRTPEFDTDTKWLARLHDIVEANICVYWSQIGLDMEYGKKHPELGCPGMIGIMARYRPGGVRGDFLEKDLADPEANVSFSIRSFSIPRQIGYRRIFDLQSIVTWDYVNEPGVKYASKLLSPTMESLYEQRISPRMIRKAVEEVSTTSNSRSTPIMTNESANAIFKLAGLMNIDTGPAPVSIYYNWN